MYVAERASCNVITGGKGKEKKGERERETAKKPKVRVTYIVCIWVTSYLSYLTGPPPFPSHHITTLPFPGSKQKVSMEK